AAAAPGHRRVAIVARLARGEEAAREVVAEPLAHRGRLGRLAEVGTDGVLERVAELVQHRLAVLRVVHVAGAEGEGALARAVPRVVVAGAARVDREGAREEPAAPPVAQPLEVRDGLVDVVVSGDLLEAGADALDGEVEVRAAQA